MCKWNFPTTDRINLFPVLSNYYTERLGVLVTTSGDESLASLQYIMTFITCEDQLKELLERNFTVNATI